MRRISIASNRPKRNRARDLGFQFVPRQRGPRSLGPGRFVELFNEREFHLTRSLERVQSFEQTPSEGLFRKHRMLPIDAVRRPAVYRSDMFNKL